MKSSAFRSPGAKPYPVYIEGGSIGGPVFVHGTVDLHADVTIGTVSIAGTLTANLSGGTLGRVNSLGTAYVGNFPEQRGTLDRINDVAGTVEAHGTVGVSNQRGSLDRLESQGTLGQLNHAGTLERVESLGTLGRLTSLGTSYVGNFPDQRGTFAQFGTLTQVVHVGTLERLSSLGTAYLGNFPEQRGTLDRINDVAGTVEAHGTFGISNQRGSLDRLESQGTLGQLNHAGTLERVESLGTLGRLTSLGTSYVGNLGDMRGTLDYLSNVGTVQRVESLGTLGRVNDAAGTFAQAPMSDVIYAGTAALTPKFGTISLGATGQIIGGVSGRQIRVTNIVMLSGQTAYYQFQGGSKALTGWVPLGTTAGFAPGYDPTGHFETGPGSNLNLNMSNSGSAAGWIKYVEV